jgi:hypothetical protein
MHFDDDDDRLMRLRRALDTARQPARVGATGEQEFPERFAELIARVKALTEQMSRARPVDWDGIDILTARMLLNEVAETLRACRAVTASAAQCIRAADESVHVTARALENGRHRVEASRRNGETDRV